MKADEMRNLKEIEMKILMKNVKIRIKKLWNNLDEYGMNKLK